MRWLFTRIISAFAIFAFLCLVVATLAYLGVPASSPTELNPEAVGQQWTDIALAVRLYEAYGVDSVQSVFLIVLPIVLIVGFSDSIGHSVILFANQVSADRFAATLLVNAVLFIFTYMLWVGSIAFMAHFVFDARESLARAMFAVALSYIPLIFSFMIALPYAGVLIGNILYLITAYQLYLALQVTYPFSPMESLICAGLGFLGVLTFRLTIGRPLDWLIGRVRNAVAGTPVYMSLRQALAFDDSSQEEE